MARTSPAILHESIMIPENLPVDSSAQRFASAYLAHSRDAAIRLDDWLLAAPTSARAHATKALMLVLAGRGELRPAALATARLASTLAEGGDDMDQALTGIARHAALGDWLSAIRGLERALERAPGDVVLIKFEHALRFMLGDKAGLLSSSERALARLDKGNPHRGFVLGMRAFALEEVARYVEAEAMGRQAVEARPDDAWGIHAVSHAQEMTGQVAAGIRWIVEREAALRACNNFGGHLFWHLALFRLEQGQVDEVLALYDREIRAAKTDDFRDIANAVSLLARLEREGYRVGDRWEELADKAEARVTDRAYVFADLHYIMALAGAGRKEAAQRLATSLQLEPRVYAAQQGVADEIGAGVATAITMMDTDPKAAFRLLLARRHLLMQIGGSDAQRDMFEQVMIDCGLRAGETDIVERILRARLAARGGHNGFAAKRLAALTSARPPGAAGPLRLAANLLFAAPPEAGHAH